MGAPAVLDPRTRQERDETLVLEPQARQRLNVARASAQALEQLVQDGAWEELHPALAAHLREHAARLRDYVGALRITETVRAHSAEAGALRRLQTRLDEALAQTAPGAALAERTREAARLERAAAAKALFQGDFSEDEVSVEVEHDRPAREQRKAARRRTVRKVARAASRSAQRIGIYVVACIALVLASVAYKSLTGGALVRLPQEQVEAPFKSDEYLSDLTIFLPAVATLRSEGTLQVVVADEWKGRPEATQRRDAESAHVFLSNRNVPRLLVRLEDGTVVAAFNRGTMTWYGMTGEAMPGSPDAGAPPPGMPRPPVTR